MFGCIRKILHEKREKPEEENAMDNSIKKLEDKPKEQTQKPNDIETIWIQNEIPILYRSPDKGPVYLKLPDGTKGYYYLSAEKRRKPLWVPEYGAWEIPKSWFNYIAERSLDRYQKLYIIQPYREQEKCTPSCWNAKGHICQCSCMGANHGMGRPDRNLIKISDTFKTTWCEQELACRLLTIK